MDRVSLSRPQRILNGHLWIFSNELSVSPKLFAPGSLVEVYDKKENFLGIGYINPASLIAIRLLTREREEINAAFFRRRITDAIEYRKRVLCDISSCRLIFSEADFLPGLIVDKFGDCLVAQFLTLGMEGFRDMVLGVLDEILVPSVIVLKNDSSSRTLEGLPLGKEIVKGNSDAAPVVIKEGEVLLEVSLLSGQKTGFFLDQRQNRLALGRLVRGGNGLDLFCYSGAWGLQLARNGAEVTFVDDSEGALSLADNNARLNNLSDRCSFVREDVFSFLAKQRQMGVLYDFIVLDPPAFVKARGKIKEGLRGYKKANALAMRLLKKGGILATSSCSYHVDRTTFFEMLRSAAKDAAKGPRLIEYRSQGPDHPVLLSVPETEYLKCAFLEM
jgi:23S rRNA (cytosine1962-C5)-methyltransferase